MPKPNAARERLEAKLKARGIQTLADKREEEASAAIEAPQSQGGIFIAPGATIMAQNVVINGRVVNQGTIGSDGGRFELTHKDGSFVNAGAIGAGAQTTSVRAGKLVNSEGGSVAGGRTLTIQAGSFQNEGEVSGDAVAVSAGRMSGSGKIKIGLAGIVSAKYKSGKQDVQGIQVTETRAEYALEKFFASNPEGMSLTQKGITHQYTKFLIFENAGMVGKATKCLEKMCGVSLDEGDELSAKIINDAFHTRFLNLVDRKDFKAARDVLGKLNEAQQEIYLSVFEALKAQPLKKESEAEHEESTLFEAEAEIKDLEGTYYSVKKLPQDVGSFVVMVETARIKAEQLSPALTHAYFSYKKHEADHKDPDTVLSSRIEWQIEGKGNYQYSPVEGCSVYKIHSLPGYYAAIAEDLGDVDSAFVTALDHGRFSTGGGSKKKHSTSGMKHYDNVWSVKIKGKGGDDRLFTDTAFDDGNGNKLVLLDRVGKHSDVEAFHKSNSFTSLLSLVQDVVEDTASAARSFAQDPQEYYAKILSGEVGFAFDSGG